FCAFTLFCRRLFEYAYCKKTVNGLQNLLGPLFTVHNHFKQIGRLFSHIENGQFKRTESYGLHFKATERSGCEQQSGIAYSVTDRIEIVYAAYAFEYECRG